MTAMSSIASTLAGSTIATSSVRSPTKETGHGLVAADGVGRDELGGVGIDAVELEIDVVEAEALGHRARELVVGQVAVADEDALGRGAVLACARSIARSIVPRSTKPRSTMTSVRMRPEPPRREGVVIPLPRRALGGVSVGRAHRAMSATASRIASSGAVRPVQRSSDAAPWATRISSPSTTSAPSISRGVQQECAAFPVDHVHHRASGTQVIGPDGERLERVFPWS